MLQYKQDKARGVAQDHDRLQEYIDHWTAEQSFSNQTNNQKKLLLKNARHEEFVRGAEVMARLQMWHKNRKFLDKFAIGPQPNTNVPHADVRSEYMKAYRDTQAVNQHKIDMQKYIDHWDAERKKEQNKTLSNNDKKLLQHTNHTVFVQRAEAMAHQAHAMKQQQQQQEIAQSLEKARKAQNQLKSAHKYVSNIESEHQIAMKKVQQQIATLREEYNKVQGTNAQKQHQRNAITQKIEALQSISPPTETNTPQQPTKSKVSFAPEVSARIFTTHENERVTHENTREPVRNENGARQKQPEKIYPTAKTRTSKYKNIHKNNLESVVEKKEQDQVVLTKYKKEYYDQFLSQLTNEDKSHAPSLEAYFVSGLPMPPNKVTEYIKSHKNAPRNLYSNNTTVPLAPTNRRRFTMPPEEATEKTMKQAHNKLEGLQARRRTTLDASTLGPLDNNIKQLQNFIKRYPELSKQEVNRRAAELDREVSKEATEKAISKMKRTHNKLEELKIRRRTSKSKEIDKEIKNLENIIKLYNGPPTKTNAHTGVISLIKQTADPDLENYKGPEWWVNDEQLYENFKFAGSEPDGACLFRSIFKTLHPSAYEILNNTSYKKVPPSQQKIENEGAQKLRERTVDKVIEYVKSGSTRFWGYLGSLDTYKNYITTSGRTTDVQTFDAKKYKEDMSKVGTYADLAEIDALAHVLDVVIVIIQKVDARSYKVLTAIGPKTAWKTLYILRHDLHFDALLPQPTPKPTSEEMDHARAKLQSLRTRSNPSARDENNIKFFENFIKTHSGKP